MRTRHRLGLLLTSCLLPLLGVGCSMQMRDALQAGVFDFVSDSVTTVLGNLFPVAQAVGAA